MSGKIIVVEMKYSKYDAAIFIVLSCPLHNVNPTLFKGQSVEIEKLNY